MSNFQSNISKKYCSVKEIFFLCVRQWVPFRRWTLSSKINNSNIDFILSLSPGRLSRCHRLPCLYFSYPWTSVFHALSLISQRSSRRRNFFSTFLHVKTLHPSHTLVSENEMEIYIIICWISQKLIVDNPSNAEANIIQSTMAQRFFENHLNPVMLVSIRKLLPSSLKWVPICQGFSVGVSLIWQVSIDRNNFSN